MLFIFDSSMADIDATCLSQNRALENILGAFQTLNHLVFIDLKDIRKITESAGPHLSLSSRAMLKTLYNKAPEYRNLTEKIDYKVCVYLDKVGPQDILRKGNNWHISLSFLSKSGLLESTILGENELDSELYYIFANCYAQKY